MGSYETDVTTDVNNLIENNINNWKVRGFPSAA